MLKLNNIKDKGSIKNRKRVQKVAKGLKKAVKAHTGQHKTLSKVLGKSKPTRRGAKKAKR